MNALTHALLGPFVLGPRGTAALPALVNSVRVGAGLLFAHQYLDTFGFAMLEGDHAGYTRIVCAVALLASACLGIGLLTPLAVVTLLGVYAFATPVFCLGNLVSVLLCWGLLLLGAGRHGSVDAWLLARRPGWAWLYRLDQSADPLGVAWTRWLLLLLFWSISVGALVPHFYDRHWQQGTVLQVSLCSPFWSDQYAHMQRLRDAFPSWFIALACTGLLVQGVWELLLLPLAYSRLGRVFVIGQGLAFFAVCLWAMNLQYLPLVELLLWPLLFGGDVLDLCRPATTAALPAWRLGWWRTTIAGYALAGAVTANIIGPLWSLTPTPANRAAIRWAMLPFRPVGQFPVNVFNEVDLRVDHLFAVIHEVDATGRPLRLVPYLDYQGGRLNYLRNDLLYFRNALLWHRRGPHHAFAPDMEPKPATVAMIHTIALLDARLQPGDEPRHYRAAFFVRGLDLTQVPPRLEPARPFGTVSQTIATAERTADPWARRLTFDLPPGHWWERQRTTASAVELAAQFRRWAETHSEPGR